jgi:hypothetical protein
MHSMETNFAAWMIGGGHTPSEQELRAQSQLRELRESRRTELASRVVERTGIRARIRQAVRPTTIAADPSCCPA